MSSESRAVSIREWVVAVGSVGAVAAVVVALFQIADERSARHTLEQNLLDEERREQAEQVSVWLSEYDLIAGEAVVLLSNASRDPIYHAVVTVVNARDEERIGRRPSDEPDFYSALSQIPPGRYRTSVKADRSDLDIADPEFLELRIEIAFTDRAGVAWKRSATGALVEIEQSPDVYYHLRQPVSWGGNPERA